MFDRFLKMMMEKTHNISAKFFALVLILLMGNLDALIDKVIHPEIPYFDEEHLIAGAASSFLTAAIFLILGSFNRKLRLAAEEQARAAENVALKEKFLSDVLDSIQDLISILDQDLRVVRVNKAMERELPDRLPFVGRKCYEAYLGRTEPCKSCPSIKTLQNGTPQVLNYPVEENGNIKKWIELHTFPLSGPHFTGVIEYVRDITARKNAEQALVISEAKFRSYIEHAPTGVFVADRTGRLVDCNPAALKLLGYEAENLMRMGIADIVPDEDRESMLRNFGAMFTAGHIEKACRLKRRGGELIWVSARSVRVTDDRVMYFCQDITEHKRAEDLLNARVRLSELAREGSLRELMQGALDEAEMLVNSSIGFFHFVDSDKGTISRQAWSAKTQSVCKAGDIRQSGPISEAGIWLDCLHQRAPVVYNNYAGVPHRKGLPEGHVALARLLAVPVMRGNAATAIIGVGNKPTDYTADDVDVVRELASLVMDLVDRKRAENALRENEGKYRLLFDSNPHPMWVYDCDTLKFLAVNEAAVNHYGYSRDEFLSMTIKDIRPEEDVQLLLDTLSNLGPGLQQTGMRRHRKKDGSVIWADIRSHAVLFGTVRSRIVSAIDVTDRRRAEAALRESEERLRAIMDNANSVVWVKDLEGRYLIVNRYFEARLGRSREQIIGRTAFDLFPRHIAEEFTANDRRVIESGRSMQFEETPLLRDKQETFLSIKFPLHDANGGIYALGAICTDITARKQDEKALYDSERNYRALVDNALVGVYRSTLDGKFLFVNDAMAKMFECLSLEEMLAEGVQLRYKNPDDRDEFVEKLKKDGQVGNYEIEARTKKGRTVNILISASITDGIISGMVLDITEHKKLEEQFRQAQKIEAIGLLAGGVAHDFNNILSAIIGFAHLTVMKMRQDDPLRSNLEQILEASNRAAVLTKSLLAFSRKQPVNLAVFDLNEVIRNLSQFLLRVIREDILLKITAGEEPLFVLADRVHLEQVIMNLVTNARDALPGVGMIIIETKRFTLDRKFIETHGYGKEGDYVLLTFSDTGTGMNEQTRSRIFEPFFTTKEQGKGTGLGLSMVYGTVKRHEGFINVYSEPGKGTTFKIYLPLVRTAVKTGVKNQEATAPSRGGTETILVAEDDAALRKLSQVALSAFGYTVIEAVDGADALLKFKENRNAIRLILLDGIMPRMNGKEAFNAIKAISPDIKCIFMSGYAEEIFTRDGMPDGKAEFILKPIAPSDLLRKIREVLDEQSAAIASD